MNVPKEVKLVLGGLALLIVGFVAYGLVTDCSCTECSIFSWRGRDKC